MSSVRSTFGTTITFAGSTPISTTESCVPWDTHITSDAPRPAAR